MVRNLVTSVVVVAGLSGLSGCVFDPPNLDGLRCADDHLCREGEDCVGGVCLPLAEVPQRVGLEGSFQKGPFIVGAGFDLIALDDAGEPTGQIFRGETENSLGAFNLPVNYLGLAELEVKGGYFNEVLGTPSQGELRLRGLYRVSDNASQTARVNVVTHMAFDRALALLKGGRSAAAAEATAEGELLDALKVGAPSAVPQQIEGSTMDILGSGAGDGWLLLLSAVVSQAAVARAEGPTGPVNTELQELLNSIADDLEDDGALQQEVVAQLDEAEKSVDMGAVLDALQAEVGPAVALPDVSAALDRDSDGVADVDDNCDLDPNPEQRDSDDDGDICSRCGNGSLDPGEDCDPPGAACSATCQSGEGDCDSDSDCGAGERCVGGQCVLPGECGPDTLGATCLTSDGQTGICSTPDGRCTVPCDPGAECRVDDLAGICQDDGTCAVTCDDPAGGCCPDGFQIINGACTDCGADPAACEDPCPAGTVRNANGDCVDCPADDPDCGGPCAADEVAIDGECALVRCVARDAGRLCRATADEAGNCDNAGTCVRSCRTPTDGEPCPTSNPTEDAGFCIDGSCLPRSCDPGVLPPGSSCAAPDPTDPARFNQPGICDESGSCAARICADDPPADQSCSFEDGTLGLCFPALCLPTRCDPSVNGNACATADGRQGTCNSMAGGCVFTCPNGKNDCGTLGCVDVNIDARACGSCTNSCGSGQSCSAGTCSSPGCSTFGAACGVAADCCAGNCIAGVCGCGSEQSACGEQCCDSNEVCGANGCEEACPVGTTACANGCFDIRSSPQNCGACDNVCPATAPNCSDRLCGACAGPGGSCEGGGECCSGQCSSSGICQCDPGKTLCGGDCCGNGELCVDAACTTCGNNAVDAGEDCDGAALNGASCVSLGFGGGTLACDSCSFDVSGCSRCGNGVVDPGEACDPVATQASCIGVGDFTGGTLTCTATCGRDTSSCSVCSDGVVGAGEDCDDGNSLSGDGCTGGCKVESGFTCTTAGPSVCAPFCGDGQVIAPEQCDDANTLSGDGCSSTCTFEPCGGPDGNLVPNCAFDVSIGGWVLEDCDSADHNSSLGSAALGAAQVISRDDGITTRVFFESPCFLLTEGPYSIGAQFKVRSGGGPGLGCNAELVHFDDDICTTGQATFATGALVPVDTTAFARFEFSPLVPSPSARSARLRANCVDNGDIPFTILIDDAFFTPQ